MVSLERAGGNSSILSQVAGSAPHVDHILANKDRHCSSSHPVGDVLELVGDDHPKTTSHDLP